MFDCYCSRQLLPPSDVANLRPSRATMAAEFLFVAVTASQSGKAPALSAAAAGAAIFFQWLPSVVRAMAPWPPTSQQVLSDIAAPASQSSMLGLTCAIHVFPASVEWAII